MSQPPSRFISCGMYAFTTRLQHAWQALFDEFRQIYPSPLPLAAQICYDSDLATLRDPLLFLGHTCGYPLVHQLQKNLLPICVPLFDVPACTGINYRSQIIVADCSHFKTLSACAGQVAAINGRDSNSGMNALRHTVAKLNPGQQFFSSLYETGSHYQSLLAVAEQRAAVAAIDCVSLTLLADEWPELVKKVRIIDTTPHSSGLPFVMPKTLAATLDTTQLIQALNSARQKIAEHHRLQLHLQGFAAVTIADYQNIIALEEFALQSGYQMIHKLQNHD